MRLNIHLNRCVGIGALLLALTASRAALGALSSPIIVNLPTQDLVYSPLDHRIYATVPNSSTISPNSLVPIDPSTGALGTAIPIGFDPTQVVISSNGQTMHAVFGGNRGIQPFDVATQTLGTAFFIPGGPQVREIYPILGREQAVVVVTHEPRFNSSTGTQVWENGVELPEHVGQGAGTGGPDIVAVDPSNGTDAYGYENSSTGYFHWTMKIDANGIDEGPTPPLYGVMTGFNIGHIELLGNRLFNSRGEVYNISPAFQAGSFLGGENFVMDLGLNRLFSITSSGSNHTIRSYDLSTLQLLATETLSGISGTASNLTRFGGGGLAFRTSNNQVVFVRGTFVPEPSSAVLLLGGAAGGVLLRRRR